MIDYHEWKKNQDLEKGVGKPEPTKKNDQGGFDPTPAQYSKFKKVDLITLPVEGTNCGNCMFFRESNEKGVGFCIHEQVREWVNNKMCCALWNNSGVKRKWES
jgi:hypothetical protein